MESQGTAGVASRRIYGTDEIIVVDPEYDNFRALKLVCITKEDGRFTPESLEQRFGEDKLIFLRNRNLHDLPTSLRGTLIYVNQQIGVVLKAKGVYLLVILFYPGDRSWCFEIVDGSSTSNSTGFYLQQIQNETLGDMNFNVRVARRAYPYLDSQGFISMDPAGPHVHRAIQTHLIDNDILCQFQSLTDTLSVDNMKVSSAIRRQRQSPFRNVMYIIASDEQRLGYCNQKNMFWVPVGRPRTPNMLPAVAYGQKGDDMELFHIRDFVCLTRDQAKTLKRMKKWMSVGEWLETMNRLANPNPPHEGNGGVFHFVIPAVHYCLVVKIITPEEGRKILSRKHIGEPSKGNQILWQHSIQYYGLDCIFTRETKSSLRQHGVMISTWVRSDPVALQKQVSYQFVMELIAAFGCGYGSRQISACLDSINIYRDARYNPRAHPSSFVSPEDIASHQYYRQQQANHTLLQPILEKILHALACQIATVGERENSWMMEKVSELATKIMATTGRTFYGFWNGCHLDSCDNVTKAMKAQFFGDVTETWQHRALAMRGFSFPTTFGIQHVWKSLLQKNRYLPSQQFMMEGLGVGFNLDHGIIQHILGGAMTHSSALPILEDKITELWTCNDRTIEFKIFAVGNSNNKRTAAANANRAERLADYRARQKAGRRAQFAKVPVAMLTSTDGVAVFDSDSSTDSDSDWEDFVLDDDEVGAERDDDDSMYADAAPVDRESDVDSDGISSPVVPCADSDDEDENKDKMEEETDGKQRSDQQQSVQVTHGSLEYDPSTTVENARGPSTDSISRERQYRDSRRTERAFPSPFAVAPAAARPTEELQQNVAVESANVYVDARNVARSFPSPFAGSASGSSSPGSAEQHQNMEEDVEPVPAMARPPRYLNRKREEDER